MERGEWRVESDLYRSGSDDEVGEVWREVWREAMGRERGGIVVGF